MTFLHILPAVFFSWCESVWPGRWVKEATWVFAIVETIHIMGLAVLLGSIFVVDLRLLGAGARHRPTAQLARDLAPWTIGSIVLMIATGAMLFTSEAVRLADSGPFFYKMVFLLLALTVQSTIVRAATRPEVREGAPIMKIAACLSLFFWFGVAFAGRAIAFL